MADFTIRYLKRPDDRERDAVFERVSSAGGRIEWCDDERTGRTYALISEGDPSLPESIRASSHATVFEKPIIALAVFPWPVEALQSVERALGGDGRPAGVLECARCGDGTIVEWDLERTSAALVLAIADVELSRLRASRTTVLLTPLPLRWWARIAAEGLQAPEIAPDRVLEALLEPAVATG